LRRSIGAAARDLFEKKKKRKCGQRLTGGPGRLWAGRAVAPYVFMCVQDDPNLFRIR
jgi:hypothetical protein